MNSAEVLCDDTVIRLTFTSENVVARAMISKPKKTLGLCHVVHRHVRVNQAKSLGSTLTRIMSLCVHIYNCILFMNEILSSYLQPAQFEELSASFVALPAVSHG